METFGLSVIKMYMMIQYGGISIRLHFLYPSYSFSCIGYSEIKNPCCKTTIGGGFGAKQTSLAEVYPAFVTWKTGKPASTKYLPEKNHRSHRHHVMRWKTRCCRIKVDGFGQLSVTLQYGSLRRTWSDYGRIKRT